MKKHVFVVGLDDFNLKLLKGIRNAEDYEFHGLVPYNMVVNPESYPIDEMVKVGLQDIEESGVTPDALIGHWDFPTTALLAVFRDKFDLPGPTLESVLIADHKYWGRLRHARVIPESIPDFQSLDPFHPDAEDAAELPFPYWMKPVIGFSSQMVYYVSDSWELHDALAGVREGIGRFGDPFEQLMSRASLPSDTPIEIDGHHCLLEKPIDGWQCTQEGYIQNGEVVVYGTIDSIREGELRSSFARYEFPSRLPDAIKAKMSRISEQAITSLGLDNTPFNIEYFWNEETDQFWLLEVNTRISKSHSPLFEDVSGTSHHEVAVDIALGRKPDFPRWEGPYNVSIKFMLRRFEDGIVTRVPTEEEIEQIERDYPGTRIQIEIEEGDRLSELRGHEVYSYEVAVIFMGGQDRHELERRYRKLVECLPLEFRSVPSKDSGDAK